MEIVSTSLTVLGSDMGCRPHQDCNLGLQSAWCMRSKKANLQRRPHEDCNLHLQSPWCMRGKKVNLQPSIQIFIAVLCVFVLAGDNKFSQ